MVEFEIEWDGDGPENIGVPPYIEAPALPPVGAVITWPEGERDVEVEVTAIELNVFEDTKGLYTVYVKLID